MKTLTDFRGDLMDALRDFIHEREWRRVDSGVPMLIQCESTDGLCLCLQMAPSYHLSLWKLGGRFEDEVRTQVGLTLDESLKAYSEIIKPMFSEE